MFRSRGRGRGGMRSPSNNGATAMPPGRDIHQGLAPTALKTIDKPSATASDDKIIITNLDYLGSYNWVDVQMPTIIVPGSPRIWIDKPTPFTVSRDTGSSFVYQCGDRLPQAPLLPLFKAVDIVAEEHGSDDFDWPSVDFVTDRNGLRKLLRWIDHDGLTDLRDFRIDLQFAGTHTVLLDRWEARTREPAWPSFGIGFERATTESAPGCEQGAGSTAHKRIITYDLNGLKMVVRFEVDACLPPPVARASRSSSSNVDDVASLLSSLNLGRTSQTAKAQPNTTSHSGIQVIHAGSADIPQASIIEMTTRSDKNAKMFNWTEAYPQLFLSQTPNHYLGIYTYGSFHTIRKKQLGSAEMQTVERAAQRGLKKLRKVLQVIQELVIANGERGRLSLVCQGGTLKVYERRDAESCLPDEILRRFEN